MFMVDGNEIDKTLPRKPKIAIQVLDLEFNHQDNIFRLIYFRITYMLFYD